MRKSLLYYLLRIGALSALDRKQIRREGVVLIDQGISGTMTMRNFRAPGKHYGLRQSSFIGAIALSEKYLRCFIYRQTIVHVAWSDERVQRLAISAEADQSLLIGYDASSFQSEATGEIELRFRTGMAKELLAAFEAKVSG